MLFQSASKLRELFVVIIAFCHTTNLTKLWKNIKDNMSFILQQKRYCSDDRNITVFSYIFNKTLILIEN